MVVVSTCQGPLPHRPETRPCRGAGVLARLGTCAARDRERRTELHRSPRPGGGERGAASEAASTASAKREEGGAWARRPILNGRSRPVCIGLPALRGRGEPRRAPVRHARADADRPFMRRLSCSTHKSPSVSVRHPGWTQTLNIATPRTLWQAQPVRSVARHEVTVRCAETPRFPPPQRAVRT